MKARIQYAIAPEQIVGGYRVVSVDAGPTPYLGQMRLYCTVACLMCGREARWIVPLLLRQKPKSCAPCARAAQRDVTLVLPSGEHVSSRELRRRYPRAVVYVRDMWIRESRAAPSKALRDPESVTILERAKALLRDGWTQQAVAEALDMELDELKQLLRG